MFSFLYSLWSGEKTLKSYNELIKIILPVKAATGDGVQSQEFKKQLDITARRKQIKENNVEGDGTFFYKIPYNGWDGRNSEGKKIANGTYVYYLKVSSNNSIIHEGLYKLTKLE